jgi:lipoteichoic acid synthase
MIHIPGQTGGGINHTYGGEIDALPTLLHLLGVDTTNYVQLGQDLFSSEHEQLVAFRDGDYVTPNYTYYGGKLYDNKTGKEVTEPDENLKAQAKEWKAEARKQLDISDELNNGNLLRFDTTSGLKAPDSSEYDYRDGLGKMKKVAEKLGVASTSLYSKNGNKSTVDLYKTETYKQLQQATTPSSSTSSSSSAAQQ